MRGYLLQSNASERILVFMTMPLTFSKFDRDDSSTILQNGADVGFIERLRTARFRSPSGLARATVVCGYCITLWDDRADDHMRTDTFDTLAEARSRAREIAALLGTLTPAKVRS